MALIGEMRPKGPSDGPEQNPFYQGGTVSTEGIDRMELQFDPALDPARDSDPREPPKIGRIQWRNRFVSDTKEWGSDGAPPGTDEATGPLPEIGGVDPAARGPQLFRASMPAGQSMKNRMRRGPDGAIVVKKA